MPPIERMKAASLRGEVVDRLVGGDAIFVEPACFRRASKIVDSTPATASACAQASPAGPAPTMATRLPVGAPRAKGDLPAAIMGVGRIALQEADRDRLALGRLAHAGLLAQCLGRTDARAHAAHDVGVENGPGRAVRDCRPRSDE